MFVYIYVRVYMYKHIHMYRKRSQSILRIPEVQMGVISGERYQGTEKGWFKVTPSFFTLSMSIISDFFTLRTYSHTSYKN